MNANVDVSLIFHMCMFIVKDVTGMTMTGCSSYFMCHFTFSLAERQFAVLSLFPYMDELCHHSYLNEWSTLPQGIKGIRTVLTLLSRCYGFLFVSLCGLLCMYICPLCVTSHDIT